MILCDCEFYVRVFDKKSKKIENFLLPAKINRAIIETWEAARIPGKAPADARFPVYGFTSGFDSFNGFL